MGLRSRQRRRAGITDPFDIETSCQHSAHSLEGTVQRQPSSLSISVRLASSVLTFD